jgi:outer membrane protein assembly factor BamE (lipoprotein component of BamABCDE complex)
MKLFICTMLLAFLLGGCAGTPFKWDQARQIKPGMTQAEVTALVGEPNSVHAQGDSLIYVWVYVNSFTGTRTLRLTFRDGKVIDAPPIPDEFK